MLKKIANTIRSLTMDAVELAGSGHPGLPMGCAELGAFLFAEFLQYHPTYPPMERSRQTDPISRSRLFMALHMFTSSRLSY
jgi:transketolase